MLGVALAPSWHSRAKIAQSSGLLAGADWSIRVALHKPPPCLPGARQAVSCAEHCLTAHSSFGTCVASRGSLPQRLARRQGRRCHSQHRPLPQPPPLPPPPPASTMAAAAEQVDQLGQAQAALYTEETLRFCQALPKVELHAHLNGSIRDATIRCCACRIRGVPAVAQRLAAWLCVQAGRHRSRLDSTMLRSNAMLCLLP